MNSKFKLTRIAVLILIAGSAPNTICGQTSSSYSPNNNGTWQPTGQGVSGSLPPIVSGSQQMSQTQFQANPVRPMATGAPSPPHSSGIGQSLPPIVSGNQQNQQTLPPIVSSAETTSGGVVRPAVNTPTQNKSQANSERMNPLRPIQLPTNATVGSSLPSATRATPISVGQEGNGQSSGWPLTTPNTSAAGVPFYSASSRRTQEVVVEQPSVTDNAALNSQLIQEINGQQQGDSVIQAGPESDMIQRETNRREGMSSVMAPRNESANGTMPRQGAPLGWNGESSYFDSSQGYTDFTPGCQDCIYAGGMANCPTCSPGNGFNQGGIDASSGYFGAMSSARRYAEVDLLYMTRNDGGSIVFSNFGGLGGFDWDVGWRATIGQREDETQGREISYFGTSDLSKEVNRVDPAGRLSALFNPVGVIDPSLTFPFFDANIQNERMQTRLHSFELNKVTWAWDVVKSFWGVRFIHVDDSYNLFSQRGVNTGDYELRSYNNLVGLHVGREMFYDIGYRISFSALGKAGVYANGNRFEVNVANNGVPFVANRADSSTFSTSLELLLTGHYQINRRARFRMGYQALLLDEVYSISDNLTGTLSPFFGSRKPDKDSMFFHGFNLGLEFYR